MIRFNKSLVALVGAVVIPLGMLLYLANLPGGGRGSWGAVLLQVAIVVVSVVLFAVFLARVVEQINGRRVRRWLASDEGTEWLDGLAEGERADFLTRLDGSWVAAEPIDPQSPVDSPDLNR